MAFISDPVIEKACSEISLNKLQRRIPMYARAISLPERAIERAAQFPEFIAVGIRSLSNNLSQLGPLKVLFCETFFTHDYRPTCVYIYETSQKTARSRNLECM